MSIALRPFVPEDTRPAADAVVAGGWGAFHRQFAFYAAQPFCLGVVAVDGEQVVGTAFGTQHGPVGWLGNVFVAPALRGQGLGTRLTAAAVEALEARGCATVVLVATDLGRPVYEKLGFRRQTDVHVFTGPVQDGLPAAGGRLRAASRDDLAALAALDRAATGEDRSALLAACLPAAQVLAGEDGRLRGYYARSPWGSGGAVIAPDPDDGIALLSLKCASEAREGQGRAALPRENAAGRAHLLARGFEQTDCLARMSRGAALDWSPEAVWGLFSFGTG